MMPLDAGAPQWLIVLIEPGLYLLPSLCIWYSVINMTCSVFISDSYVPNLPYFLDFFLVGQAKKVNHTLLSGMKVKELSRGRTLVFGSVR